MNAGNFCHPENPGSTHWSGCECHEARWEEKLAIAEAASRPVFSRRMLEEKLAAAEERARRLEEALRAEAILLAAAAGIQAVAEEAGRTTKASEVYQYLAFRLALLAPPPEAEEKGGE